MQTSSERNINNGVIILPKQSVDEYNGNIAVVKIKVDLYLE